eukprot:Anaeramoba_ignava/a89840_194.p1 GENE.a89840_194~~a89840_194.p1  ORF type:complete len:2407 (-),score=785.67 a89840_194:117-7337(-)
MSQKIEWKTYYFSIIEKCSKEPDPTTKLDEIEEQIKKIIDGTFPKEQEEYFIKEAFYSIINSLWKRNDFDQKYCQRVNDFFKRSLDLICYKISEEDPNILSVLGRIFARPYHGFYEDYQTTTWECNLEDDYYSYWIKDFVKESEKIEDEMKFHFAKESMKKISGLFLENIEYFGQIHGFEKIISHILSENYEISLKTFDLLKPIEKISNQYTEEFLQYLVPYLQKILDKILQLEFGKIRKLEKKSIMKIADLIFETIRSYDNDLQSQIQEEFKLDLAEKFIHSTYLEMRVAGLTEIRGFILNLNPSPNKKNIKQIWITKEKLLHWIKEKKIVELIFGNHLHRETINRTDFILEFLAQNGEFTEEIFYLIWNASNGQHQTTIEAIYNLVSRLSQYFPEKMYNFVFNKFINIEKWDVVSISLLQNFARGALEKYLEESENKQIWIEPIKKFWGLITDLKIEYQTKEELFEDFKELFVQKICANEIKHSFLNQCISNLKEGKSIPFTLKLLTHIFSTFPKQAIITYPANTSSDNITISALIRSIQEENNLIQLVIEEMENFKNKVSKIKNETEDLDNFIVEEGLIYIEEVSVRLEFLKFIIENTFQLFFSEKQTNILWDLFFKNSLSNKEKDYFLDWTTRIFCNDEMRQAFFQKSELFSPENLTNKEFDFFKYFSKQYNYQKQTIKGINVIKVKTTEIDGVYGIKTIWNIILKTTNEDVATSAIYYLVEYQNLTKKLAATYGANHRENFISHCMKTLQEDEVKNNSTKILRVLKVLVQLIHLTESDIIPEFLPFTRHMFGIHSSATTLNISIKNDEKTKYQVQVSSNESIFSLRKKISKLLNKKFADFSIVSHPAINKLNNAKTLLEMGVLTNTNLEIVLREAPKPKDNVQNDGQKFEDDEFVDVNLPDMSDSKEAKKQLEHFDQQDQYGYEDEDQEEAMKIRKEFIPTYILSQYFEDLFKLLEHGNQIAQKVWYIILRMPTNKKYLESFLQMLDSQNKEMKWNQIFHISSVYKLIYQLQIVDRLMNPMSFENKEGNRDGKQTQEAQKIQNWSENFIQTGGLKYLIESIPDVSLNKNATDKSSISQATSLILKVIFEFIVDPQNITIKFEKDLENIDVEKFLNVLFDLALNFSVSPETNHFDSSHIVFYAINIICSGCSSQKRDEWVAAIRNRKNMLDWIRATLLRTYNDNIRGNISFGIYHICKLDCDKIKKEQKEIQTEPIVKFFIDLLLKLLDQKPSEDQQEKTESSTSQKVVLTNSYFQLLSNLIEMNYSIRQEENYDELIEKVVHLLQNYISSEQSPETSSQPDEILIGYLNLARVLLNKEKYRVQMEEKHNLIKEIFEKFLFDVPKPSITKKKTRLSSKCQTDYSRKASFDLLNQIVKDSPDNFIRLFHYLKDLHKNVSSVSTWSYETISSPKSPTGYLGLTNLGATCYMNSLLQQLYMVPEFRKTMLSLNLEEYIENEEMKKRNKDEDKENKDGNENENGNDNEDENENEDEIEDENENENKNIETQENNNISPFHILVRKLQQILNKFEQFPVILLSQPKHQLFDRLIRIIFITPRNEKKILKISSDEIYIDPFITVKKMKKVITDKIYGNVNIFDRFMRSYYYSYSNEEDNERVHEILIPDKEIENQYNIFEKNNSDLLSPIIRKPNNANQVPIALEIQGVALESQRCLLQELYKILFLNHHSKNEKDFLVKSLSEEYHGLIDHIFESSHEIIIRSSEAKSHQEKSPKKSLTKHNSKTKTKNPNKKIKTKNENSNQKPKKHTLKDNLSNISTKRNENLTNLLEKYGSLQSWIRKLIFLEKDEDFFQVKIPNLNEEEKQDFLQNQKLALKIIKLLYALHEINKSWFFLEQIDENFINYINSYQQAISDSEFISKRLSLKLFRQLGDQFIVYSYYSMPKWIAMLMKKDFLFLFPFNVRLLYFRLKLVGIVRSVLQLQMSLEKHVEDYKNIKLLRLNRFKIRIDRKMLMKSFIKLMKMPKIRGELMVEVEYFDEVGVGSGPTNEFFDIISHELQKKYLGIWIDHGTNKKDIYDSYAETSFGLFPCPLLQEELAITFKSFESKSIEDFTVSRLELFYYIGIFVARAIMDERILDLSFSYPFFKLITGESLTINDLFLIEPEIAKAMIEFSWLVTKYETIKKDRIEQKIREKEEKLKRKKEEESNENDEEKSIKVSLTREEELEIESELEEMEELKYKKVKISDLSLDFTLPGYQEIELIPNGKETDVQLSNLSKYVQLVLEYKLDVGIRKQVGAFKRGFSEVFPIENISIFTFEEFDTLINGYQEKWTKELLLENIKCEHGYTEKDNLVQNLVEILCDLDPTEQKLFLKFVTGNSRLPVGGIACLNPRLTVVKKDVGWCFPDDYLPTVMTCANYLKIPDYSTKDVLKKRIFKAMRDGQSSFHLS